MAMAASFTLEVDFQDGTFGGGTATGLGTGRRIIVVDENTAPPDPFGVEGNRSLLIEQNSSSNPAATVQWNLPDKLTLGSVKFSAYSLNDDDQFNKPRGNIYLYQGSTIGVNLTWNEAGALKLSGRLSPTGAYESLTLGADWSLDQAHEVEIVLLGNESISIYLDGVLLSLKDSEQSVFYWKEGITHFDNIRVANPGSSNVGSQVFFDDLKIASIPEPGSLSMMLTTCALGWIIFARFRRK